MPISTLQNFYKETVAQAWTDGAGTFYVSTKPTPSTGILVISPSSASLREIVRYSSTGTDGNGDYVVIDDAADRGLGGTTAQAHAVGEPVRMNYTAEHQQELSDAIDQIVAAGAQYASASVIGIAKLSAAPADAEEPIAVGDNDDRLPSADVQAAFAGVSNAPDASNPFVTKDDLSDPAVLPPQVVAFTASGTWTKDAGLKYVTVEVQGAGANGAGGAAGAAGGAGGGGGGYARKVILASALAASETVTVGTAGIGSGNTSFGTHALGGNAAATTGGSASGGDVNIPGQDGAPRIEGNAGEKVGGRGGNSILGFGGREVRGTGGTIETNGTNAKGYGGGGGGAASATDGAPDAGTGGSGTAGIVIVTEHYS